MISFKRFTEGILGSNTYLVWDSESKEAALIDAGNRPGPITELLEEQKLTVKYIILTHAHFDHIYYLPEYRKTFSSAQTVIHEEDNALLANPRLNASTLFGSARVFEKADLTVREGDTLLLGKETLKILSTPGHTPGSICILAGTLLFSGDTLFYSGFGRTDLGAGSVKALSASIERLYTLQEDIEVYPGHGTKTSIGREKACNPFLDFWWTVWKNGNILFIWDFRESARHTTFMKRYRSLTTAALFPCLYRTAPRRRMPAARAAAEFGLQRTAYAPRSLRLRQSGRKRRISCRNGKSIRLCVGSRGTILPGAV